jgi:gas vesicle protein
MDNHNHHGSGFMNGLILGGLIGAGIVFLLGTKKGKQVLKAITENGFENIQELRDLLEGEEMDDIEEVYSPEDAPVVKEPAPKSHRFFKGIRK